MTTIVITGANRGIGLEIARQLKGRGDDVIAAVRTPSPELEAIGVRIEAGIDVATDAGPGELKTRLGDTKIDVLVNNAGLLRGDSLGHVERADARAQMEVNAFGPLFVTEALRDNLQKGGKVAIITSRMGSIADNGSGGQYGYRMSKAAVNAAGKSLAIDLEPRKVAVAILHPGFVRTDMTGGQGMIDPDESARLLIERIDGLDLASTGTFWHANGDVLPW